MTIKLKLYLIKPLKLELEFANIQSNINDFKKSKTYNNNWTLFKGDKKNKAEVERINERAEVELMEKDALEDPSAEQIEDSARIIHNTLFSRGFLCLWCHG